MKTLKQLDNKYKEALQEYEVAPREEQWQRFSVALEHAQKSKKRKYFFFVAAFFLLSGAGAVLYFMKNQSLKHEVVNHVNQSNQGNIALKVQNGKNNADARVRPSEESAQSHEKQAFNANQNLAKPAYENRKTATTKSESNRTNISNPTGETGGVLVDIDNTVTADAGSVYPGPRSAYSSSIKSANPFGKGMQPGAWAAATLAGLRLSFSMPFFKVDKTNENSGNGNDNDERRGLYLTLSGGPGFNFNTLRKLENADKQHKDVGKIFAEMQGKFRSTVFQAGLVYVPKKGPQFSVSGGIQYRQLTQTIDFNYSFREIPFKDIDGRIIGYVYDTTGRPFNYQGVNSLRFVSVPLYLRFPVWSSENSELFVGAGVQLQGIFGAQGSYLDVNRIWMDSLTTTAFRKWSLGYTLGAGYSRWLNKRTALFGELQAMVNRQTMFTQTGNLYSRLIGLNMQAGIKIKLK